MKRNSQFALFLIPLLLAAKPDPFSAVPEPDRSLLSASIQRFAKDEVSQNWGDSYEITEQDVPIKRELGLADNAAPISRDQFIERMKSVVQGGSRPVLKSFELTEVKRSGDHYSIRACCKGARESFRYQGIIEVDAKVSGGSVRFGSWSYVVNSPHSCTQKEDSSY